MTRIVKEAHMTWNKRDQAIISAHGEELNLRGNGIRGRYRLNKSTYGMNNYERNIPFCKGIDQFLNFFNALRDLTFLLYFSFWIKEKIICTHHVLLPKWH